jgi:hypothetical protein
LVLVPDALLVTPQQLAVFVNLLIDEHGKALEGEAIGRLPDEPFQQHGAAAHLAHLEGHVPARPDDSGLLGEHLAHQRGPCLRRAVHGDVHAVEVDAGKPAERRSSINEAVLVPENRVGTVPARTLLAFDATRERRRSSPSHAPGRRRSGQSACCIEHAAVYIEVL